MEIYCSKCGQAVEVESLQGDYSTFVCDVCQEEINKPAYIAEIEELKSKESLTESEMKRIEFLSEKIG